VKDELCVVLAEYLEQLLKVKVDHVRKEEAIRPELKDLILQPDRG